jgi:hypothetical protein
MANEIVKFGGLNFFPNYFESMVIFVMRFGRIMKILEDQWKCSRRTIIFNVKKNKIMYRLKEVFGRANGIVGFGGQILFF